MHKKNMKQVLVLLLLIVQYNSYSQSGLSSENPPVFPDCKGVVADSLQVCFDKQIYNHIYRTFKVPERITKDEYKGEVVVLFELERAAKGELDNVDKALQDFENKAFNSQLNIQFTHSDYARFDRQMNVVGANSHTASKPFVYEEISSYFDFEAEQERLKKDAETWGAKKLWNEHLVQLQGKDYWFTVDPILDLQVGRDTDADFSSTFNNTRGFVVQGGLGSKLNFYSSVFESQGRFADYVNRYAETLKAFGPDPAIIPGRGIAKRFKTNAYDYPVAEAYLSYAPYLNPFYGPILMIGVLM